MRNLILTLSMVLISAGSIAAETVDRIVVSVGNLGVTESEVNREVRFAQFLDGQPQTSRPSRAQRIEARDRLIQQNMLAEEADLEQTDISGLNEEATQLLEEVRKLYPDESAYREALASTGYTEEQAMQRLVRNVRIVRLINRRLRPNAWVERQEIEDFYQIRFVQKARQDGTSPPKLDEVETVIREALTQQKVDNLLDQWLKEIEGTRRVKIHAR